MIEINSDQLVKRFFDYVAIDSKSDFTSASCPSTNKQFKLAQLLVKQLEELGLSDISLDDNCYIMATLPATTSRAVPVVGFIAHLDTSPDFTAENVNPQIISNYKGDDIVLNKEENIVLSPSDFPELLNYTGQDLITTDGTTLLGADDKAGVCAIMSAMQYLQAHPEIEHGTIKIGFTPDEEIGRGADLFDVVKFGADFAYTIDGGEIGQLEFENFNAAGATITVKGRGVHPGMSKNKMINAINVGMELHALLPTVERPEHTEGYEGFFHLTNFEGGVDTTKMEYIIRDHSTEKFEQKKTLMQESVNFMNKKYAPDTLELIIKEQYLNMRCKIEPVMHIVDIAEEAMIEAGVSPKRTPIRGGTDGARLSYMGLPTPNIFTGGHNYHGRYEYLPISSLVKATEVIVRLSEKIGSYEG